jgi:hypothetical protein
MKIRLFLPALCLLLLPMFVTPSNSTSSQFSAYAGGYLMSWSGELIPCECDEPGCSGGDCPTTSSTAETSPSESSDLGSESLLILAALILWLRLRA